MTGAAILSLIGKIPLKTWALIGLVVLCGVTLAGVKCAVNQAAQDRADRKAAEAQLELARRASRADTRAADQRLTDVIQSQAASEELHDAIDHLPDARPSDRRVALGCARLRRQREPDLPAVCRSEGGRKA